MINEFDFDCGRDSSVLYGAIYKQVAMKYKKGSYEEAAELALAYMQVMLNGRTTTDDEEIAIIVEPYTALAKKANERYQSKVQRTKESKIKNLELDEIAEMVNNGETYSTIAAAMDISKSTVAYRVEVIREQFPELLVAV